MKILVTNDDSINSKGLHALAIAASKYGDVFIVAPSSEQSGKSHGIEIKKGFELKRLEFAHNLDSFSVSSTPADCVRTAYYAMDYEFEIVLSGINDGLNIGEDIFYSGTVAAISEGQTLGKKGIAFSAFPGNYMNVINNFDMIMEFFKKHNLFDLADLYNINVPNNPIGLKITKQGSTHFDTRFDLEEGMYYQRGNPRHELDKDNENSDVRAIHSNYISITPLINDRTNYDVLEKLKNKA